MLSKRKDMGVNPQIFEKQQAKVKGEKSITLLSVYQANKPKRFIGFIGFIGFV